MNLVFVRHVRLSILFLIALTALSAAAYAQNATPEATASLESSKFDIPPEIAGHEKEWPLGNHDYNNTRAAVGSPINSSNVKSLGPAWTFELEGTSEWGGESGSPVISDGVVYVQDMQANTYALDFKTGEKIWKASYSNQIFGPAGPGIGYGKVFVCTRIDRYSALDMKTGKELWSYSTGTQLPTGAFQPSVFDHRVYAATQAANAGHGQSDFHSYQPGSSGSAIALDPDTGKVIWQWMAVEEGFWGHPEINSGGGIWFPAAIDTETGITYWNTGNPAPLPGLKGWPNGSSRPGPNLYTNSQIALDHATGKMLWYQQVKPHDLFNLDFQDSPILAQVKINAQMQKIVIGAGKNGVIFGFDAAAGQILWKTPVGLHQNDELQALPLDDSTTWVAPGAWGGVETPMAYADGVIYAQVANLPSPYNATAFDAETGEEALNRSEGGSSYKGATSELDALDAATGKILWKTDFPHVGFAGATVVNDLVFTASLDGIIYALARDDGHIVWQYQAPGGTNAWPAVAGDTIVWPIGLGDKPLVLALRLGANIIPPTPETMRTPVKTPEGG